METRKPLKRHEALVPLSHDHHQGLLLCWKIRTGLTKSLDPKRIIKYVSYFFKNHLTPHFIQEEEILLSRLNADDEQRRETEDQHRQLHALYERLMNEKDDMNGLLKEFERILEKHIRFEERQLFPYLQHHFDEATLKQVGTELADETPFLDDWEDPFWLK